MNTEINIQDILSKQFEQMNKVLETSNTKIDSIDERVTGMEEKMKETIYSPDMKALINEKLIIDDKDIDDDVESMYKNELIIQLIKENKDYEWLVKKDEGHGFHKTKNKIELYSKIDEFIRPYRDQ